MKYTKILLLATVLSLPFISVSQDQGEVRLHASVARGNNLAVGENLTWKPGTALTVGGEYIIVDGISFAPSYTLFFQSVDYAIGSGFSNRRSFRARIINLDARYYLPLLDWIGMDNGLQVYGLAGIAMYKEKIVQSGVGTAEIPNGFHDTAGTGINLGVGAVYPIDNMSIYAQYKYQSPVQGRMIFDIGIGFLLGY